MLEDMGNAVKILDTIVPAFSIQVDNVPGYIDGFWYNPYFEIAFEDGDLWVVEDFSQDPDESLHELPIVYERYHNWYRNRHNGWATWDMQIKLESWEQFLRDFNIKRSQR